MIVVAAGPGPRVPVPPHASVIAADGGLERALALGLAVDTIVGDLDSAGAEAVRSAEAAGTRVIRYPTAKDATDLELALDEAVASGAHRVLVVASAEGRLDHLVASLLLLGADRYATLELDALVGDSVVHVVRATRAMTGAPGELISLLALGGAADGVATEGLAYPLAGETLEPGSSRGVSNTFVTTEATVTVAAGVVLAIRVGGLS